MQKAIFPGTFDPPTLGHLNIVRRAAKLFDGLYVAIGENTSKPQPLFSIAERIDLLQKSTQDIPGVKVVDFHGLLVDFAREKGITTIVRAMRNYSDFESETAQAHMNQRLGELETVYLLADENYRQVSSTLIREIAKYGKDLGAFLPKDVAATIARRFADLPKP